jgi:eukaryotic-like serine/threonine-protein kinase
MSAPQDKVASIFDAAVELETPVQRAAYLDAACGADQQLRAEVEQLLQHDGAAGSFLHRPAAPGLIVTVEAPAVTERPSAVIGPYKLLQQIGEGGMGTVWMAQQTRPVQRQVALKVIKPGMDTRQVIARFEAERQALALMDHPHIAKVLDGGTTENGRPYFVMELVKGVPITQFCDDNRLTLRARLELFVSVCQAVQHAHQKGIIHRDLKPSNVLVASHDGSPVVKVIDFGVAKALGQELTDKTLFTGFAQMVGTPLYMSPEQAGQSGLDVDTRTDVYALGVLLYELLTGTTPFDKERLRQAGYDELRRIIREEEPAKPSTRISTLGQAASTASTNRQSDPRRLSQLFRGELDWIVMKALDKDRSRRYETASAFAADVQLYLKDEPVQACPPSALYHFGKFARRYKRSLATAGLLGVMLLVAVLALTVSFIQTREGLEREQQTAYVQRIALAERELAVGNVGRAEQLLEECPQYLRGWEWHFLKRQRYESPLSIQHSETVGRVAFSPDDRQIATVWSQGQVAIRDARTGEILYTLDPRVSPKSTDWLVRSLVYSRDGRYLAAARRDGVIHVWDPTTGKLLHTLVGHKEECWQVAFSPDSQTLASGSEDRSLRLWDMASGKELQPFPNHPAAVKGVAFRPDGRSVLAACEDGTVKVWDRDKQQETFSFRGELPYRYSAWFSPDAQRLAWSSMDGAIKIWNTNTGRLEIDKQTDLHQCRAVVFHPDGKRIALAGFDGKLRVLDAVSGNEMLTIFAHRRIVADAVFNRDGTKLASASYDGTVRIWDARPLDGDPQPAHCVTLPGHQQRVTWVDFSPDGWLASSSEDGTVKVWEPSGSCHAPRDEPGVHHAERDGYILRYTLRHGGHVSRVVFSSDNRILVSGGWDKTVKLWDRRAPVGDSLTELRTIDCAKRVSGVALSPDGQFLAIGQPNRIALYNPATGDPIPPFKPTPAPVPGLAFTADSQRLISAGASDPAIKFWDPTPEKELKELFEIRDHAQCNQSVAVTPDGRLVATPAGDSTQPTVYIWEVDLDTNTYKKPPLHILKGHAHYVWNVTFSPDGKYLASGSWDSTVKIWDVNTGKELATLRGHAGTIYGLAFSPDGRRLASGSGFARHGELKVWDANLWENGSIDRSP